MNAFEYLHNRNVDDASIHNFGISYFNNNQLFGISNSVCFEKLCSFVYKLKKENVDLSMYNNCILIPILDLYNNICSFAARHLDPNCKSKFIGVKGFKKNLILFGLNNAIKSIIQYDEVILVEGYWEVIALNKVGIHNVVALCGCSISDIQISTLLRFTKNFKILLDPDIAGEEGSKNVARAIETFGGNTEILRLKATIDIDEFLSKFTLEELIKSCGLSQKYLQKSHK